MCLFQINYTRLLNDLDGELKEDLRSGRHLPRIVDKALRLFNLKQVLQEVETSVMSKVSCTACKAGNYNILTYMLIMGSRFIIQDAYKLLADSIRSYFHKY